MLNYSEILLRMIFSLICFLKERAESSVRPRCLCSFILATTVPLNIKCGWLGLDVLQENKTSVKLVYSVEQRKALKLMAIVEEKCPIAQRDGQDTVR